MKGLTSIELAILLAIIIVIAVAVGWYMYTTFVASTSAQAKLIVSQATYYTNGTLSLVVTNPGPAATVTITNVFLNGTACTLLVPSTTSTTTAISLSATAGAQTIKAKCSLPSNKVVPGTTLQGYVVLSTGTTFPFTAVVS
ncbi:MAG: sodium:proline symporter [Thermoproteus sp.]